MALASRCSRSRSARTRATSASAAARAGRRSSTSRRASGLNLQNHTWDGAQHRVSMREWRLVPSPYGLAHH